jgi:hypothetical protein
MSNGFMEIVLKIIQFLGLSVLVLILYGAYDEHDRKDMFDQACKDAGGIPLKATYHYDKKQNRIEYTCLSVNAILDVE